jgi:menaquinol-cytochrome c reductase cytochrome b/c subunit
MASIDERRASFQRYKQDVKERGKPFFPYAMFEHPCYLGPRWADKADPGTVNFVPRPDWYFYFLFQLLRIFKWPDSVILGTVGIPTVLLIIAFALPFVDRTSERRLSRRPVAVIAAILVVLSMGILTYKGATAKEALATELVTAVPKWAASEGFASNPTAVAGAKVFATAGCLNCHTYQGSGSSNLGAPDLSAEGTKKNATTLRAYIANPRQFGNPIMPPFASLGTTRLHQIATFLSVSKGAK